MYLVIFFLPLQVKMWEGACDHSQVILDTVIGTTSDQEFNIPSSSHCDEVEVLHTLSNEMVFRNQGLAI
jgi:hypothetical protein